MPNLYIDVYEHAGLVTVQQMRAMIAGAVSQLRGDTHVTYTLDYLLPSERVRTECLTEQGTPIAVTVSEMRRRLARRLSRLDGEQKVTFSFHCKVPEPIFATRTITAASEIA